MEWPSFNSEQPKDASETKADEEDERRNSKEKLLIAIASGELNENDEDEKETYNYLRGLLEKKCQELGVEDYSVDTNKLCNEKINEFCNQLNKENGTHFEFTFDKFREQLTEYLNQTDQVPADKRIFYFDSLTKNDTYLKGGTTGIFAPMQMWLGFDINDDNGLPTYLGELISEDYNDISQDVVDIFGESEPKTHTNEERQLAKERLEEFVTKYEIAKIYSERKSKSQEIKKIREKIFMDVETEKNPEFVKALSELKSNDDVTYFFHGSAGQEISQKINEQGLYAQYGGIERTAVSDLTPYELLTYGYGTDKMGSHTITIIAVPKGEYVMEQNHDQVEVQGTNQGFEQGSFIPKYKIPNRYIYGYIDKDNKQIIKNPQYVEADKEKNS